MGRAEPKRGLDHMSPEDKARGAKAIQEAMAGSPPVASLFDPPDEDPLAQSSAERSSPPALAPEPEAVGEPSEPEPKINGALFGAVDDGPAQDLPRRALRTDTKAWPGRDEFEARRNGESAPAGNGADATLAASLDPQMGFTMDVPVVAGAQPPKLTDKLVIPPFSVLDTKADYWQKRRNAWKTLGMRAETISPDFDNSKIEGNLKDGSTGMNGEAQKRAAYNQSSLDIDRDTKVQTGTSIFDPVLCEVAYRWFSNSGHKVLDPFGGGAVRGVMAGVLGRYYTGIELRAEQLADNRAQAEALAARCQEGADNYIDLGRSFVTPTWIEGDATQLRNITDAPSDVDLVFTCPPYADLEVYSHDPRDLSTAPYATFRALLAQALAAAAERLKRDRFAVVVIGEARHVRSGMPYDMVTDVKLMMRECGLPLYNEIVLLNSIGSAAVRAGGNMKTRKVVRVHQHVIVGVKGDPKKAAQACGTAELDV